MAPRSARLCGLMLGLGIVAVCLALFATTASAQPAPDGRTAYVNNCGFCHGTLAQGGNTVPVLAGLAGKLPGLGIAPADVTSMLTDLVRHGVPDRMPAFSPDMLSDQDVAAIGAYLLTTPPASGTSIYVSRCSFCHGLAGEGIVGPPLQDARQLIAQMGWTPQQAATELGNLVHGGIPGRMPAFDDLTDVEVARLVVALVDLPDTVYWQQRFTQVHGRPPTVLDRLDYDWALEFIAQNGRPPTQAETDQNTKITRIGWQGGPPPGAAPGGPGAPGGR